MITEAIVTTLLNDPTVVSFIGTPSSRASGDNGIFPNIAPPETTMPYVAYVQYGAQSVKSFDGTNRYQRAHFLFAVFASTYSTTKRLSRAVRLALNGMIGQTTLNTFVDSAFMGDERESVEKDLHGTLYRVDVDYTFGFADEG